jgi:hypothetical protein
VLLRLDKAARQNRGQAFTEIQSVELAPSKTRRCFIPRAGTILAGAMKKAGYEIESFKPEGGPIASTGNIQFASPMPALFLPRRSFRRDYEVSDLAFLNRLNIGHKHAQ